MNKIIIEICCSSMASIKNAIEGKANRIELCQNLLVDGLSPSSEFLDKATSSCDLPIHVLIRPRSGNFFYNISEIEQIEKDINRIKEFPIQGIVVGALKNDQSLAIEPLKKWRKMFPNLDFTFHRAFDVVKNCEIAAQQLVDLGFNRILTSGQQLKANDGIDLLKKLNSKYSEQISIMPGGGINERNIHKFLNSGFKQIHLSARTHNEVRNEDPVSNLEIIKSVTKKARNSLYLND
jgi:copper homeostasis protein